MSAVTVYSATAVILFALGLYALLMHSHMLRLVLALNVMASGVFLLLVAQATRAGAPDPVPHAMVITGIVVAVSATALAVALARRVREVTGRSRLSDQDSR